MALSNLLLRRLKCSEIFSLRLLSQFPIRAYFSSLSNSAESTHQPPPTPKPTSLSARMSFIFEQIDEIDKKHEEKDETLQRIRAWRESKKQINNPSSDPAPTRAEPDAMEDLKSELVKSESFLGSGDVKKEVELVHPWAEWIELMERLVQQNYFDHRRKDEDGMMEGLGIDFSEGSKMEDKRLDFARDFRTVQDAVINFGRDRFDILRSLSRQDLQILVGYGCPTADKRVVFSSKLLRKHVHLDEGDVCSSCRLRSSCEKAYLLTNKEDEARTIDVMRILLEYGFDPTEGSVANKSLLKMKSVKTVVRKLLHEVVKLSAVPIDPNLPPPVIKKPPPKVKQPPPTPKRRVGRDDVEMKKGDWLCAKCDFMNFAKNTVCLQCDAKRPKRQLLPGEWECPECNFLNYRRNTACFHCEHKRPPDTYGESQFSNNHQQQQRGGPRTNTDKLSERTGAWNFDFDDNESDGADVAQFEFADSQHKFDGRENNSRYEDGFERGSNSNRTSKYSDSGPTRPSVVGFNDFDEEDDDDDVDNYEVVAHNEAPNTPRVDFSELEADSESEDFDTTKDSSRNNPRANNNDNFKNNKATTRSKNRKAFSDSDVDFDTDDDLPVHPKWKSSHVANEKQHSRNRGARDFGSDDDSDEEIGYNRSKKNEKRGVSKRGGGRSSFREESFSGTDSDDGDRQRGNNAYGGRGQGRGRGRGSGGRGGERMDDRRSSMNRGFDRSSGKRNNGDFRESSYNGRDGKFSKPRGGDRKQGRGGGSFGKRGGGRGGGRSNRFDDGDSYEHEESNLRPRANVR
ncbi:hypothetical protein ABFS82_14G190200 [Erythranthe guttata]